MLLLLLLLLLLLPQVVMGSQNTVWFVNPGYSCPSDTFGVQCSGNGECDCNTGVCNCGVDSCFTGPDCSEVYLSSGYVVVTVAMQFDVVFGG